eukprot:TRINITY_DN26193_c0_g1_i1.p1 TRINITY_DN26193_c0_g1~~TRINITY_DN26193_c0_g1_i1.p1  ORF type:complete len:473 (+),score=86.88 TRINITY_DN26193_c0_g1_i1:48-1421(+)
MARRIAGLAAAALVPSGASAQGLDAPLSFVAVGDWGGLDFLPTPEQRETAAGMASTALNTSASFVIALGDNFYPAGITTDVSDPLFKNVFEDVYTQPALQVPWRVVVGNHDHLGNLTAQIAYTEVSDRWRFPSLYYSRSESVGPGGGRADFFYLDTDNLADEQVLWLNQGLQNSTAEYIYVVGHHPVWSACSHGRQQRMVDQVWPLLQKFSVTAYLAGHDHCQEMYDTGHGPLLVISGTGRGCCYDLHPDAASYVMQPSWSVSRTTRDGLGPGGAPLRGGFMSVQHTRDAAYVRLHNAAGGLLVESRPLRQRTASPTLSPATSPPHAASSAPSHAPSTAPQTAATAAPDAGSPVPASASPTSAPSVNESGGPHLLVLDTPSHKIGWPGVLVATVVCVAAVLSCAVAGLVRRKVKNERALRAAAEEDTPELTSIPDQYRGRQSQDAGPVTLGPGATEV